MRCQADCYSGNEPYAFISFSHEDESCVYPIIERLTLRGYRLWFDDGIHPGADWPERIAEHIRDAAVVLAFLTEAAADSHNCGNELTLSVELGKPVLAILLDDAPLPLGIRLQIASTQHIAASGLSEEDLFAKFRQAEGLSDVIGPPVYVDVTPFRVPGERADREDPQIISSEDAQYEPENASDQGSIQQEASAGVKEEGGMPAAEEAGAAPEEDTDPGFAGTETIMDVDSVLAEEEEDEDDDGGTIIDPNLLQPPLIINLEDGAYIQGVLPVTSVGRTCGGAAFSDIPTMSGHHADVESVGNRYFVTDAGSRNGTWLHGARLAEGEKAEIAEYTEVRFSRRGKFALAFGETAAELKESGALIRLVSAASGEGIRISEEEMTLGRANPWPDGSMSDRRISREHTRICVRSGAVQICDQSANGTYVDGERLESGVWTALRDGAVIQMGSEKFYVREQMLHSIR